MPQKFVRSVLGQRPRRVPEDGKRETELIEDALRTLGKAMKTSCEDMRTFAKDVRAKQKVIIAKQVQKSTKKEILEDQSSSSWGCFLASILILDRRITALQELIDTWIYRPVFLGALSRCMMNWVKFVSSAEFNASTFRIYRSMNYFSFLLYKDWSLFIISYDLQRSLAWLFSIRISESFLHRFYRILKSLMIMINFRRVLIKISSFRLDFFAIALLFKSSIYSLLIFIKTVLHVALSNH